VNRERPENLNREPDNQHRCTYAPEHL